MTDGPASGDGGESLNDPKVSRFSSSSVKGAGRWRDFHRRRPRATRRRSALVPSRVFVIARSSGFKKIAASFRKKSYERGTKPCFDTVVLPLDVFNITVCGQGFRIMSLRYHHHHPLQTLKQHSFILIVEANPAKYFEEHDCLLDLSTKTAPLANVCDPQTWPFEPAGDYQRA